MDQNTSSLLSGQSVPDERGRLSQHGEQPGEFSPGVKFLLVRLAQRLERERPVTAGDRTTPKFLLVKKACFDQVWADYYAYCRASPTPLRTWSWRHFLTWAYAAYPGEVKTSYDFLHEVILTGEWCLVGNGLIEVKDDPSEDEDPIPQREG